MQFLIGVLMICCVAAVAIAAGLMRLLRTPARWIGGRGRDDSGPQMPPPARYVAHADRPLA